MRKHFLILMLMALLPLASWAADAAVNDDLAKAADWTYDATAKAIVTAGTASEGTITFAVTATEVAPAATAASTWYALGNDALKRKDAGTYYAWYKVVHSGDAGDDIAPTLIGAVVVSKETLTITPKAYGNVVYGATDYSALTDYYTIPATQNAGGFYDGDTELSEGLIVTATITEWAKDHPVAVDGDGNVIAQNYTVSAQDTKNYIVNVAGNGTITITKKPLTITADDKDAIVYGGTLPTWTVTYAGLIDEDQVDPTAATETPAQGKLGGTLAFTVKTAGNVNIEDGANAGAYIITPSGLTSNNYTIGFVTGSFTIQAKNIEDESIVITGLEAVKYKGANYNPEIVITDGDYTLENNVDYIYSIKDADNHTIDNLTYFIKNQGTYTATITASGNYQGSRVINYVVQKAALVVKFANATKTYNAKGGITQDDLGENVPLFTLLTLKGSDTEATYAGEGLTNLKKLSTYNADDKFVKAGGYEIKCTKAAADAVFTNYDCTIAPGTLTINKATLTFKGTAGQSKKYGTADPALTYVYEGVQNNGTADDDITKIVKDLDSGTGVRYVNVTRAEGETIGTYAISCADAVLLLKGTGAAADNLGDNYQLAYDNTVTFEIKTNDVANIVVTVFPKSRVYDGTNEDLEFTNLTEDVDYMVTGLTLTTDKVTNVKLRRTPGKDRGVYDLEVVEATFPAGYTNHEFNNSTFTILPKEVTITTADQTVTATAAAATAPALNQTLVTIDGLVAGDTDVAPKTGVTDTNVNAYELSIEGVADYSVAGIHEHAITFAFSQPDKANYVIKENETTHLPMIVKGTLIIAASANNLILDRDDADLADKIEAAAEACAAGTPAAPVVYTVNFAARNLKAKQWYALTLPFETSVSELSSKLGYAVVNILDASNSDASKVKFKLWMETIEANQPFVIKVYNEDAEAHNSNFNSVTFSDKTIVYAEGAYDEDAANNKFIGTYENTDLAAGNNYWIMNGGKFQKVTATASIKPIVAYLQTAQDLSAFAPSIYVEDVNGEVTAINNVNYTKLANQNEGWYTINGVKLNAAPTEKGVYIQNGKKVIIK